MRVLSIFLLLQAVRAWLPTISDSDSVLACKSEPEPFKCVLKSASLQAPLVSMTVQGKELVFRNVICSQSSMEDFVTTQKSSNEFNFGAAGMTTECTGEFEYGLGESGPISLNILNADVNAALKLSSAEVTVDSVSITKLTVEVSTGLNELNQQSVAISNELKIFFEKYMLTELNTVLKEASSKVSMTKIHQILSQLSGTSNPKSNDFTSLSNDIDTLVDSPTPTDDNGNPIGDFDASWLWVGITFGCTIILATIGYYFFFTFTSYNQEKSIQAVIDYTNEWFTPVIKSSSNDEKKEEDLVEGPLHISLLQHPQLHPVLRYFIPIAIAGNFAIFLYSNIINSASKINVAVTLLGVQMDIGTIFELGLGETIKDMWDAKVYALALFILFFSAMWPYIKLMGMFICWCIPTEYCSLAIRENILIFLDGSGKWALIDYFVMLYMLCAFYVNVSVMGGLVVLYITTEPTWGYYSLLWGILTSLILGHVIVLSHRHVTKPSNETLMLKMDHDEPTSSVASAIYVFYRETKENWSNPDEQTPSSPSSLVTIRHRILAKWTWLGYFIIQAALIIVIITFVIGLHTISVGFDLQGSLIGAPIPIFLEQIVDYSTISIGTTIPLHSGIPHADGVIWVQVCYFAFTIFAPTFLLVNLLILWNIPMHFVTKSRFMIWAEVMAAWSALDVYAVATVLALLQVKQFASFIMEDCHVYSPADFGIPTMMNNNAMMSESMRSLKQLGPVDACFSVEGYFSKYAWLMFFPAFGMMIITNITLLANHHVLIQRIHPDYMSPSLDHTTTAVPEKIQEEVPTNNANQPVNLWWENCTWQNIGYYGLLVASKVYIVEILQEDNFVKEDTITTTLSAANGGNNNEGDVESSDVQVSVPTHEYELVAKSNNIEIGL